MDAAFVAKAREIDTKIAAEWNTYYDQAAVVQSLGKQIETERKRKAYYRTQPDRLADIDLRIEKITEKRAVEMLKATELYEAAAEMDRNLYEGWNRFFLVKHIHRSTRCSSFRPTTRIGWLPDVSGLTEADAVAEHGETLCTICYPSAPTELTQKKADPAVCGGSPDYNQPSRRGYYSNNWATCGSCGTRQTLTTAGNLRKHKK